MLEIVRIARRAIVRVLTREIIGVFAHVERADQNRAGCFEARQKCRVLRCRRAVPVDLGARARREPIDVEKVLDRERRASERSEARPARPGGVYSVGFGKRACRRHIGEGAEHAVAGLDTAEGLLRNLARAYGAGPDGLDDSLSRAVEKHIRHGVNTGAGSS